MAEGEEVRGGGGVGKLLTQTLCVYSFIIVIEQTCLLLKAGLTFGNELQKMASYLISSAAKG